MANGRLGYWQEDFAEDEMSGLKFCRDCKWAERGFFGGVGKYANCLHPNARRDYGETLVTGQNTTLFCLTMRDYDGRCGEEGKLFEARP